MSVPIRTMTSPGERRTLASAWRALAAALLLLPCSALSAAETLTLTLRDADLSSVIATVSEMTGKNFIVDPRVKGKVTVISNRPMSADEIYEVFLSILSVHGFAAVPTKNAIKIVPEVNAKQDAIPTVSAKRPGVGDEYVTRVIDVENVPAAQLVPILRPLLPQQAHLAALPTSNVLIASAGAANIQRLVDIVNRVDLTSDGDVEVIRLEHAAASEVVRVIQSLYQATPGQQPGEAPILVADERTNSVLVSGGANRLRIRTLISHLDTPLESGGNTEVIYLRYANATEMVDVLKGIASGIQQGAKPGQNAQAAANDITIQSDEATNAIVINAAPDVMRSLKAVIQRLDVRRAQVLVEAVIAEVSAQKANEFGVQWAYYDPDTSTPIGIINFSGSGLGIGSLAASAAAGNLTSVPDGALLGAGDLDNTGDGTTGFAAFVRALAGDANTNILSTPSLVTLDNEEAEIVVGQNVPFVTGSYTAPGGTGSTPTNPFQTIQRQDVGLTLKVKPQINEGDAVKLEVSQEVSNIASATTGAADLITNKRSLKTVVIVDDGQAVVLGGLIDDNLRESTQKVPGLGDIPLLGRLFRYDSTVKEKRNLMVFLHPIILRNAGQNASVTGAKYSYMRARQLDIRQRGVSLMADDESPLMPEFDKVLELPPSFEVWKKGFDERSRGVMDNDGS